MLSIEEYTCNLIAGNNDISELYHSVDRARDIVNKDNRFQRFSKKISFQGIGCKVYTSSELIYLDDLALCKSINNIILDINNPPTIDDYVLLLLKGKTSIRELYQACCKAKFMREQGKQFYYTFTSPYPSAITNVDKRSMSFKNANELIYFFCKCEKQSFNPKMVFDELFV
jgi:hypothetical protein